MRAQASLGLSLLMMFISIAMFVWSIADHKRAYDVKRQQAITKALDKAEKEMGK